MAAIQRGNLIELSTGVLGVDEACSGIRSFQSTLMAALFLDERVTLLQGLGMAVTVASLIAMTVIGALLNATPAVAVDP